MSKFDIWLSRISQISQVGFFIVAIIGFFYTVIPLYQNELLNEAVARKTMQLEHLQTQYDNVYAANRKQIVKWFIFSTGAFCSGLLQPPQPYIPLGARKEHQTVNPMVNFLATHSTTDCFIEEFNQDQSVKLLRQTDRDRLKLMLIDIGKKLDENRRALFQKTSIANQFDLALNYSASVRDALQTLDQLQWPADDGPDDTFRGHEKSENKL